MQPQKHNKMELKKWSICISVKQMRNKPKTQQSGIGEDITAAAGGGGESVCIPPEIFIKGGEDDEYRSVFMDWNSYVYLYTTETK